MVVELRKYGNSLGTRSLGAKIREDIEKNILNDEETIFDFTDMEIISNSFADECFAKLLLTYDFSTVKKYTTFINTNSSIKKIILGAINARLKAITV